MKHERTIRVAVIGVGNMGQHHVRVYSQLPGVTLVGVCDVDPARGRFIAERFHTRFFTDYQSLIDKRIALDAVSIVVPTKFHEMVACFFAAHTIHVLLEKPIAETVQSAKRILDVVKQSGVKFTVGHIERFNPAVVRLKQLIDNGTLGTISSIVVRRIGVFPPNVRDANVLLDLAVHDVDVIAYLLGEYPKKTYIHSAKIHTQNREDSGELFLEFRRATAFIQVNWITPVKVRTLAITGTKGYAELDYMSQQLVLYKAKINKSVSTFSELLQFSSPKVTHVAVKKDEPLKLELASFIESIRYDRQPRVTGEEALRSLAICLKN